MMAKKDNNQYFILKIVLLTILLIAAFGGVVTCSILLASKGIIWQYLIGFLGSLSVFYWSIVTISDLSKKWSEQMIAEIRSGKIDAIAQWHHDEKVWNSYLSWRKTFDKEESKGIATWAMIIGWVIFFISFYSDFGWLYLTLVTMVSGIALGLLIGCLFYLGYKIRFKKLSSSDTGLVVFTREAILINNLLVYFNQMGTSLSSVKIVKNENWDLLEFIIATQVKERKNEHTYLVPIPIDKMEEANKLVTLYCLTPEA